MNRKQKIIVSITGIILVSLILVGLTYAYFLTKITGNTNSKSISVTTADLKLVYNDGSDGVIGGELIEPSDTVYTKTFTVKNEGNTNIEYGVYLIDVINQFVRKEDIKYTLDCTTDGTIICNKVTTETTFPSGISQLVTNTIEPNKTHTYTFTFTYKDTGTDQSIDMNKELSAKIQIYGKNSNNEYFPYEEGTLAYSIINNVKNGTLEGKSTFTANLSITNDGTTASDKILSTAEDDEGISYYFRGNPIDNYMNFAGMCWRIVRIQGDRSVKLILASEKTCSTTNLTEDSGIATDGARGVKGQILSAEYGTRGISFGEYSDYQYVADYTKDISSTSARVKLNEWLDRKLTNDEKNMLKNEKWCIGDVSNVYDYNKTLLGNVDDVIKNQSSHSDYYYKSYFLDDITLKCNYKEDLEIDFNKVGLLTSSEVRFGGASKSYNENIKHYLIDNASKYEYIEEYDAIQNGTIWILLNAALTGPSGLEVYGVDVRGDLINYNKDLLSEGNSNDNLRPVIVLKSTAQISGGNGTISNPYTVTD